MAEALYRKYRPQVFGDVVGQEHIERTIRNAIEHDKTSHAYLFTGPRGTGKTTTARLLAKALLCEKGPTAEPDGTCQDCLDIANGTHPDVYELDAASRTGVDNVREEIIGRVQFAPTRGRYKIYIIDEVHMLSVAAFNALLKTLEEPPSHVVFIMCTTDPQKVPETIHSRCQRFDFHRISNEAIIARLGTVCGSEGIEYEPEALELIAYRAEGGMRNALTALEQLIAFGDNKVTVEAAERMLGSMDSSQISEIVEAIGRSDAAACFNRTAELVETGTDLAQFVRDLAEYVRNLYLMSLVGVEIDLGVSQETRAAMSKQLPLFGPDRLSNLLLVLGDLSKELRVSTNARLSFEIALTRMVRPESDLTLSALAQRVEELERALASGQFVASSGVAGAPVVSASAQQPTVAAPASTQLIDQSSVPGAVAHGAAPAQTAAPRSAGPNAQFATHQSVPRAAASAQQPVPAAGFAQQRAGAATPVQQAVPAGSAQTASPAAPSSPRGASRGATPAVARPQAASVRTQASSGNSGAAPARPGTTVAGPQSSAAPASVNLSNPASLQRLWRSITTALRKANPARGVLFMNAKVSSPDGSRIVVAFAADNAFAHTAATKPEVMRLLAATIEQVAGGSIPFELVLMGDSKRPAIPASTMTTSQQPSSPAPQQSASPARQGQRLAPMVQGQSILGQPVPDRSIPGQSASSQVATVKPVSRQAAPIQSAPGESYAPDDEVPLDVYDSYASSYDEDSSYVESAPVPSVVPEPKSAPQPRQRIQTSSAPAARLMKAVPATTHTASMAAPQQASSAAAATQVASGSSAASSSGSSRPATAGADRLVPAIGEDAERLEKMFNDAFGGGVRFYEES